MAVHQGLKMRTKPVVWWVLVNILSVYLAQAELHRHSKYCYSNDTHRYHHFGTKTPYDYVKGHFSHLDLVPEGKPEADAVIVQVEISRKSYGISDALVI